MQNIDMPSFVIETFNSTINPNSVRTGDIRASIITSHFGYFFHFYWIRGFFIFSILNILFSGNSHFPLF